MRMSIKPPARCVLMWGRQGRLALSPMLRRHVDRRRLSLTTSPSSTHPKKTTGSRSRRSAASTATAATPSASSCERAADEREALPSSPPSLRGPRLARNVAASAAAGSAVWRTPQPNPHNHPHMKKTNTQLLRVLRERPLLRRLQLRLVLQQPRERGRAPAGGRGDPRAQPQRVQAEDPAGGGRRGGGERRRAALQGLQLQEE